MSDSEQSSKINEFAGITNLDLAKAKFYLESASWNIESALDNFYEEGAYNEPLGDAEDGSTDIASASIHDTPRASTSSEQPVAKPLKWTPQSRIRTFSSLKNAEDKDKDSDDDEQRYYVGGSITSGQQVIGPPRNNANGIIDMFQTALKYVNTSAPSSSNNPTHENGSSNFSGTGYTLGHTENDTEDIPSPNSTSTRSDNHIEVVLKIFREGFTINDGELYSINRPENREFLLIVARGEEIPPLLLRETNVTTGDELRISVEDHRYEEYVPPKQTKKVFEGSGILLESSAPETVGNDVPKETPSDNGIADEEAARAEVPLTPDTPTTSLQIRFADGTRLIAEFNLNHTIGDVRRYIMAARSSFSSRPFKLQTSFPPTTLEDDELTLLEAGLLNTVIFQRIG